MVKSTYDVLNRYEDLETNMWGLSIYLRPWRTDMYFMSCPTASQILLIIAVCGQCTSPKTVRLGMLPVPLTYFLLVICDQEHRVVQMGLILCAKSLHVLGKWPVKTSVYMLGTWSRCLYSLSELDDPEEVICCSAFKSRVLFIADKSLGLSWCEENRISEEYVCEVNRV